MRPPPRPSIRRRGLVVVLAVVALGACATTPKPAPPLQGRPTEQRAPVASAPLQRFVGTWRETWGVGEETDVDFQDVYIFALAGGSLSASCPEKESYEFGAVKIDGDRLRVQLVNGEVIIDYDMRLAPTGQQFDGTAVTSEDIHRTIRWDRAE